METDKIITVLLGSSAGLYLCAWVIYLLGNRRGGLYVAGLAWVVNVAIFGINWHLAGGPPLGNMYHVQVLLSLCFVPTFLMLRSRESVSSRGSYFAFVSAVPLVGALFMTRDVFWRPVPALQSAWFVPHVVSYVISYSLAGVAFVLTVMWLVRRFRSRGVEIPDDRDEAAYHILRIAFPFMTFGLASGALWAEEAWGVYWSWDPKETWSLITWTIYVIYFHCRTRKALVRFAPAAQVTAFLALIVTFLLVNLLPKFGSALHSYTR